MATNHVTRPGIRKTHSGVSRRALVKAGLGALAAPAVLRVIPANAQSRVIKIGHVSPRTGPLAGFGEADGFILGQVQGILENGLQVAGRTYKVEVLSKDSQSNASRAAEVASELILRDKVDLIVAASTPDTTNPVADQAEVNEVPCITTDCPWQPYFFGRKGDPAKGFTWTYHFFWASRTSSRRSWRCGIPERATRWWAACFPTTPTATPGATRSSACRRRWPRPATGSPIPAVIR